MLARLQQVDGDVFVNGNRLLRGLGLTPSHVLIHHRSTCVDLQVQKSRSSMEREGVSREVPMRMSVQAQRSMMGAIVVADTHDFPPWHFDEISTLMGERVKWRAAPEHPSQSSIHD
jgi:hypothetical protein